jgi:hypothetical protein
MTFRRTLCTVLLTISISSSVFAGNIGGMRTNGNIGGMRTNAPGNIGGMRTNGNIGGMRTNASGNIGGMRTNSNLGLGRRTPDAGSPVSDSILLFIQLILANVSGF